MKDREEKRREERGGEGREKERGEEVNEELWEPMEISLRSSHRPPPGLREGIGDASRKEGGRVPRHLAWSRFSRGGH